MTAAAAPVAETTTARLGLDTGFVNTAVAAVAVFVAVAPLAWRWDAVFADAGHRLPIIVASLLGVGAAAGLAAATGWRRSVMVAAGFGALVVGLAGWYATSIGDLPGDAVDAWKDVASVGLLLPTTRAFVIVPVIVAAVAGFGATVLAVRGPAVAALLPLAVAHGVTTAYTVERTATPWWVAPLLIVAVLAASASSARGRRRRNPATLAAAGALAAALAVAAAGVAIVSDDDRGFDLRERLERPVEVATGATPLAELKRSLIEDEPVTVFEISLEGLDDVTEVQYLPVVELDAYDGTVWSVGSRFEASGAALPLPAQAGSLSSAALTQRTAVTGAYPFAFLPRAGVVRDTTAAGEVDLAWSEQTGAIALIDPTTTELEIDFGVQLASDTLPAQPAVGPLPANVRSASTPPTLGEDQVPVFERFVAAVGEGAASDYDRLVQLETILRSDRFGYNTDAPSGHSLAALTSYLEPNAGTSVGFAEQSATVFAVAARQFGSASRVVVGYRLPEPLTAAAPTATVTEDQLHAWPEVWIDTVGWVRFEPTNTGNETTEETARTPAVSEEGQAAPTGALPDLQEPVLIPDPEVDGDGFGRWRWPLIVLALPLVYLAGVMSWRAIRRRRRRSGGPDHSTIGAWLETRDRLRGLGLPAGDERSPLELADELSVIDLRDVAEPVEAMAPFVDSALFAPAGMPHTVDDAAAWQHAGDASKAAAASVGWRRRLRALADPRA
ncbi:MAG: transglutaminase-like domain-containing protein [Acidimicrobiales bacterium]